MERRDFLTAGAATATTMALGAEPAEASQPVQVWMTAEQMNDHLRNLDRQLAEISHNKDWLRRQVEALRPAGAAPIPTADAELARCEALTTKMMRGLLVLATARDLPEHGRMHPGMQARMTQGVQESSEAMAELTEHMNRFSPADRMDIESTLQRSPELVERLTSELEQGSAGLGITARRREHTRKIMTYLKRRLQRHSSSVIFDEYQEQVAEILRRPAAEQGYRAYLVAKIGEAEFTAYEQRMQALALTWAGVPMVNLPATAGTTPVASAAAVPSAEPSGSDVVNIGNFRFKIAGDKIFVLQIESGENGTTKETVLSALTPPKPPLGLALVRSTLTVDVGEYVVSYDVSDPAHPFLGKRPLRQASDPEAPAAPATVKSNRTSNNLLIATGILMGLALVCGLLCFIPSLWCVMITPLALFFVAGLICMIIGLATRHYS